MIVAIYSRKSKFTEKGESIENQVQMCKDYLINQNRSNEFYEFLIYEDEGFSGSNINRPEFKRLMNDVTLNKFSILICYRLDRISRNVADFSSTLETLQRYNISFISIREQFNTSSPMGRAMIYIASVFAQLERETIAERVRDNMLELSKSGRWLGGTTPLGYKATPFVYYDEHMIKRKMITLSINNDELEVIKLIYDKYLELKSLSSLESYLLENYYKTRTGANFRKSTLRSLLTNPVYAKSSKEIVNYLSSKGQILCGEPDGIHGFLTYNKLRTVYSKGGNSREFRTPSDWIVAVSKHTGIIESEDWLKVQKVYARNSDKFTISARSHNALLTGILKCAICGSSMRIVHGPISKTTGTKLYYYACTLKKDSKGSRCKNPNGKVNDIDSLVVNSIKELLKDNTVFLEYIIKKNMTLENNLICSHSEDHLNILIIKKKNQIDNLINEISLNPDLEDLIIPKLKELKEELNQYITQVTSKSSHDKITEKPTKTLSYSFIKSLLDKHSIIDTLTHDDLKEFIRSLILNITWNGSTQYLNIHFVKSIDKK